MPEESNAHKKHVERGFCSFVEGEYFCDDQADHKGDHWRSTVFPVQQDGSKREPLLNATNPWGGE